MTTTTLAPLTPDDLKAALVDARTNSAIDHWSVLECARAYARRLSDHARCAPTGLMTFPPKVTVHPLQFTRTYFCVTYVLAVVTRLSLEAEGFASLHTDEVKSLRRWSVSLLATERTALTAGKRGITVEGGADYEALRAFRRELALVGKLALAELVRRGER